MFSFRSEKYRWEIYIWGSLWGISNSPSILRWLLLYHNYPGVYGTKEWGGPNYLLALPLTKPRTKTPSSLCWMFFPVNLGEALKGVLTLTSHTLISVPWVAGGLCWMKTEAGTQEGKEGTQGIPFCICQTGVNLRLEIDSGGRRDFLLLCSVSFKLNESYQRSS